MTDCFFRVRQTTTTQRQIWPTTMNRANEFLQVLTANKAV